MKKLIMMMIIIIIMNKLQDMTVTSVMKLRPEK